MREQLSAERPLTLTLSRRERGQEGPCEYDAVMRSRTNVHIVSLLFLTVAFTTSVRADSPSEWLDPDTGHRVVRLSTEPGSASLYFHQNAYTPDGKKLIIT